MQRRAKISLTQIDQEDKTFCITFMPDLEPLLASIRMVGILEPPTLRERDDGSYQIVSGFKRVEALRLLSRAEVEANIYDQGELDDLQALLLTIGHNLIRPCNLVEKALCLAKLRSCGVSEKEVIDLYLPLLGLQPHKRMLQQVMDLLRLERGLGAYLVSEELSLSTAILLLRFEPEDQTAVLPLLEALRPGENRVKEIISFLQEIALREGVPVSSVLAKGEIVALLEDQEIPRPQRLEQLRQVIKGMRFPHLQAMEERFVRCKRALSLPPQITLYPPAFFEGVEFRMELRFRGSQEFRDLVSRLQQIAQGEVNEIDTVLSHPHHDTAYDDKR